MNDSRSRIWNSFRSSDRVYAVRLWPDQEAIIQACCDAWNALAADAKRIKTLTLYPWIEEVTS